MSTRVHRNRSWISTITLSTVQTLSHADKCSALTWMLSHSYKLTASMWMLSHQRKLSSRSCEHFPSTVKFTQTLSHPQSGSLIQAVALSSTPSLSLSYGCSHSLTCMTLVYFISVLFECMNICVYSWCVNDPRWTDSTPVEVSCSASGWFSSDFDAQNTDAALLPCISYPAFAVDDDALYSQTLDKIVRKLKGKYGFKRFLRDGYRTANEDKNRRYYRPAEMKVRVFITQAPSFF